LENILLDSANNIRICDFSCAQPIMETQYRHQGTPDYMCPEALSTNVYKDGYNGLKADIFSLGMILFFLAFGQPAWKSPSIKCMTYRRMKEKGMNNLLQSHPASKAYMTSDNINQLSHLLE
jgi:serine/threonine protein kinase